MMKPRLNLVESPEKFEQVHFYHLVSNHKYIITDLYGVFHYVGIFSHEEYDTVMFKNVSSISPLERYCGNVTFSYEIGRRFYRLISKKEIIQETMESRAINKILQKITCDNNFIWQ